MRPTLRYAAVHQDGVSISFYHSPSVIKGDFQITKVFPKGKSLDHWNECPVVRLHHIWVWTCWHVSGWRVS